jgi:hypothetical protein
LARVLDSRVLQIYVLSTTRQSPDAWSIALKSSSTVEYDIVKSMTDSIEVARVLVESDGDNDDAADVDMLVRKWGGVVAR